VTQEALQGGEKRIVERFKQFSLWGVLIAGLIDGLNPCAFATIVFLVSYLSFLGKASKEILTYGIIFTLVSLLLTSSPEWDSWLAAPVERFPSDHQRDLSRHRDVCIRTWDHKPL